MGTMDETRRVHRDNACIGRRDFLAQGLLWALMPFGPAVGQAAEANVREAGDLPFLRGVNFSGLTHEVWNLPPAEGACSYFVRDKRMNVVRLNFSWEFIQPELGAPLNAAACAAIDVQIDRISAAGGYIVLELHNYGRRTLGETTHIIGESAAVTAEHFSDVWRRIAERWRARSRVLFALMNEPHDQDTKTLVHVSNAAIAAIRRTGARQLVMVSGNDWNSMGWQRGSNNQKWMLEIQDEIDNFCFDVHHYFDDWSVGQSPNVRERPIESMEAFTEWARAHRKRGFCGEFGCYLNRRGVEACRALLKHIEANRDVFIGWAWWGAGGAWQPDYVFLLDPFARINAATNTDLDGSRLWRRPIDRPQMKLLQEFLPKSATPFNGWLMEDGLGPRLRASWRRGDYRANVVSGTWISGGRGRLIARGGPQPAEERKDGGVEFRGAVAPLKVDLALTDEDEVFAIAKLDGGTVVRNAPRTLLHTAGGRLYVAIATKAPPEATEVAQVRVERIKSLNGDAAASFTLIGATDIAGRDALTGVLYDLVVVAGPLSEDERLRIEGRLHWDAGLAHQLPKQHPYRTRPPATARASSGPSS